MKKLISGITLAVAGFAFVNVACADLSLEQRLPNDASDADVQIGGVSVAKSIQRLAAISLMLEPNTPVFSSDNINANGDPIGQSEGTAAGIYMNEVTGGKKGVAKDPAQGGTRFGATRGSCIRTGPINEATRSAPYNCTVNILYVSIKTRNWEVQGRDFEPESSAILNFDVRIKADRGDTNYTSELKSDFVTLQHAG